MLFEHQERRREAERARETAEDLAAVDKNRLDKYRKDDAEARRLQAKLLQHLLDSLKPSVICTTTATLLNTLKRPGPLKSYILETSRPILICADECSQMPEATIAALSTILSVCSAIVRRRSSTATPVHGKPPWNICRPILATGVAERLKR